MCMRCSPDSREHAVVDALGRRWLFEMHHFCGPLILRQDGAPRARQPGSRSRFWPAFEAWQAAQRARSA